MVGGGGGWMEAVVRAAANNTLQTNSEPWRGTARAQIGQPVDNRRRRPVEAPSRAMTLELGEESVRRRFGLEKERE